MVRVRLAARLVLAALALLGPARAADAVVSTTCVADALYDAAGAGDPLFDSESTSGSCGAFVQGGGASLTTDGEAAVGAFLARSEAAIFEGPRPDQAYATTNVDFRDTITVSSEGRAGQIATVHGQAFLSGLVDVTGTGRAGVRLEVITSPGGISQVVLEDCTAYPDSCFGSFDPYPRIVDSYFEVDFNVVLGNSVSFGLSLTTSASRGGNLNDDPGSALAAFGGSGGGSISWGGIDQVTVDGTPVPFSVSAESATDWTQPVPEPATWLTGSIALLALGALRR
jgi:hypothetical protein